MLYCELTPNTSRGTIHVQEFVFLEDSKLKFDEESRRLVFTDCKTGEVHEAEPVYTLELSPDPQHSRTGTYTFSVALKLVGNKTLDGRIDKSDPSKFQSSQTDLLRKSNREVEHIPNPFIREDEVLEVFWGLTSVDRALPLSLPDKPLTVESTFACRDLVIREHSLQTIDIRTTDPGFFLTFRIAIAFDKRLTDINLKVQSLTHTDDLELTAETSDIAVKCKNCEFLLEDLYGYRALPLPSDLYLHSIGSVYCEECQDDLATAPNERIKPAKRKV